MKPRNINIAIGALLVLFFCYLGYDAYFNVASTQATDAIEKNISNLADNNSGSLSSEYFGNMRAKIAIDEYGKNVVETTRGCNCGIIIDQYTQGNPAQWCTMFASWVTKQAGSPFKIGSSEGWRINNSRRLTEYLQEHGTFFTKEYIVEKNLSPQIGDFVIFYRGNYEESLGHTDIVVALGKDFGTADLVGGNVEDRVSYRSNFQYLDYYGFIGFGRPEKTATQRSEL